MPLKGAHTIGMQISRLFFGSFFIQTVSLEKNSSLLDWASFVGSLMRPMFMQRVTLADLHTPSLWVSSYPKAKVNAVGMIRRHVYNGGLDLLVTAGPIGSHVLRPELDFSRTTRFQREPDEPWSCVALCKSSWVRVAFADAGPWLVTCWGTAASNSLEGLLTQKNPLPPRKSQNQRI